MTSLGDKECESLLNQEELLGSIHEIITTFLVSLSFEKGFSSK